MHKIDIIVIHVAAEVDYRPVSVSMMQEMRVDIINEVENKFASLMEVCVN